MAAKCTRSERPPSSSSSDEEDPQTKRIDRCLVLIGKNVDLFSFTFDAPSFNIENLFVGMGWVPLLTLNNKVYPTIVKDFYTKMNFSPGSGVTCLLRNKRVKITQELIRSILHLEDGGIRLYTTKTIPHTDVAKSKGFDDESGPSTLPFEDEDLHDDEDAPPLSPPRPRSHRPSSSTSGFNEDHFNLLNGRIDSLASTVDGLQHVVSDLQNTAANLQTTVGGLQTSVDGITFLLHAFHSYLDTEFPPPPPPEM
ncbi:Uncharacterized protein Adt_45169 [Abeliophyllum distichum]|uniref:Uncharacterized protein n=1 Tax=Abeliophyllum distichum TaxID=126358 RepID=A0ABD1PCX3_9LAMI